MGSCCVEKKPGSNGMHKRQEHMNSAVHDSVKVGKMSTALLHEALQRHSCTYTSEQ